MKFVASLIPALWVLLAAMAAAQAAPVTITDLSKAKITWQAAAGGGPVTEFRVKCGTATGAYTKSTTVSGTTLAAPLATAAGTGTWFCVVSAANAGVSPALESANSAEVSFTTVAPPLPPLNVLIVP